MVTVSVQLPSLNKLTEVRKNIIQERISNEVCQAKYYSIQVDSTQDISSIDQFSIVVRYVHNEHIYERLLSVLPSNDNTGQGLFNLVTDILHHHKIDPKKCISDSTDGAASYHAQYNGLQRKLTDMVGGDGQHIHIWCYAHILNLVMIETTKCCVPAISFFNLIQNVANFIKSSYKRMAVWKNVFENQIGPEKMKRLKLIGETRWSGKSNAATTIFGCFSDPSVNTFIDLLACLSTIQDSDKFDPKIKQEAQVLLQNLSKFETILTAFTYLYIFETTVPLSNILQTSTLDIFTAWNLIETATTRLKEQSRTFENIHKKTLEFVNTCNDRIFTLNNDENKIFEIDHLETALPQKRRKKKKVMADELIEDEANCFDPLTNFKINVFNLVMDRIVQSLDSRFVQHKQLFHDLSCLDARNFKSISEKGIEDESLKNIIKLCPQVNKRQVISELSSFASNFETLKLVLNEKENVDCNTCKICSTCPPCILKILASNRLNHNAYDNLYELYKVICTLSVTQVQCERTFSKLKIIKSRLRNSLSEENLESYMIFSIEKKLLHELDAEAIIDKFAHSSSELKRLLTV